MTFQSCADTLLAQPARQGELVLSGQSDVEKDQGRRFALDEPVQRRAAADGLEQAGKAGDRDRLGPLAAELRRTISEIRKDWTMGSP